MAILTCIVCNKKFVYEKRGRPPHGCPKHAEQVTKAIRKKYCNANYKPITKEFKELRDERKEIARWAVGNMENAIYY